MEAGYNTVGKDSDKTSMGSLGGSERGNLKEVDDTFGSGPLAATSGGSGNDSDEDASADIFVIDHAEPHTRRRIVDGQQQGDCHTDPSGSALTSEPDVGSRLEQFAEETRHGNRFSLRESIDDQNAPSDSDAETSNHAIRDDDESPDSSRASLGITFLDAYLPRTRSGSPSSESGDSDEGLSGTTVGGSSRNSSSTFSRLNPSTRLPGTTAGVEYLGPLSWQPSSGGTAMSSSSSKTSPASLLAEVFQQRTGGSHPWLDRFPAPKSPRSGNVIDDPAPQQDAIEARLKDLLAANAGLQAKLVDQSIMHQRGLDRQMQYLRALHIIPEDNAQPIWEVDEISGKQSRPLYNDITSIYRESSVNLLLHRTDLNFILKDYDTVVLQATKALVAARKLKYEPLIARCHFVLGKGLYYKRRFRDACLEFRQSYACDGRYDITEKMITVWVKDCEEAMFASPTETSRRTTRVSSLKYGTTLPTSEAINTSSQIPDASKLSEALSKINDQSSDIPSASNLVGTSNSPNAGITDSIFGATNNASDHSSGNNDADAAEKLSQALGNAINQSSHVPSAGNLIKTSITADASTAINTVSDVLEQDLRRRPKANTLPAQRVATKANWSDELNEVSERTRKINEAKERLAREPADVKARRVERNKQIQRRALGIDTPEDREALGLPREKEPPKPTPPSTGPYSDSQRGRIIDDHVRLDVPLPLDFPVYERPFRQQRYYGSAPTTVKKDDRQSGISISQGSANARITTSPVVPPASKSDDVAADNMTTSNGRHGEVTKDLKKVNLNLDTPTGQDENQNKDSIAASTSFPMSLGSERPKRSMRKSLIRPATANAAIEAGRSMIQDSCNPPSTPSNAMSPATAESVTPRVTFSDTRESDPRGMPDALHRARAPRGISNTMPRANERTAQNPSTPTVSEEPTLQPIIAGSNPPTANRTGDLNRQHVTPNINSNTTSQDIPSLKEWLLSQQAPTPMTPSFTLNSFANNMRLTGFDAHIDQPGLGLEAANRTRAYTVPQSQSQPSTLLNPYFPPLTSISDEVVDAIASLDENIYQRNLSPEAANRTRAYTVPQSQFQPPSSPFFIPDDPPPFDLLDMVNTITGYDETTDQQALSPEPANRSRAYTSPQTQPRPRPLPRPSSQGSTRPSTAHSFEADDEEIMAAFGSARRIRNRSSTGGSDARPWSRDSMDSVEGRPRRGTGDSVGMGRDRYKGVMDVVEEDGEEGGVMDDISDDVVDAIAGVGVDMLGMEDGLIGTDEGGRALDGGVALF